MNTSAGSPDPVFLVNQRSGGQAGRSVARILAARCGSERVFDLEKTSPQALADRFAGTETPLIAAGGDGTVVSLLEAAWQHAERTRTRPCPVGVVPLGTGNDLASVAGWPVGAGHQGRLEWALAGLNQGHQAWIDRWVLRGPGLCRAWYNYCSWGSDARIARHFDRLRCHHPKLFRNRILNKAIYVTLGLSDVAPPLTLEAPGLVVPPWTRALVAANIHRYAGGGLLQGVDAQDGQIDLLAMGPGLAMGLASRGVRQPKRVGRVPGFTLHLRRAVPMQLDGEPLVVRPGRWQVEHAGRALLAVYPSAELGAAEHGGPAA